MFHSEAWKCLKRAITLQQYKAGWYVVIVPCHEIWFKLRDWFLVKWHEVTSTYYVLCCDAWIVAKRVNKFRSIWHWQRFTEDDRAFPSLMVDPRVEYLGTTNNITAQWAEKQTYILSNIVKLQFSWMVLVDRSKCIVLMQRSVKNYFSKLRY